MILKSNNLELDQKIWVKNTSVIEEMFGVRIHESNWWKQNACINDNRSKPNMTEWLTESTQEALFQFSNKYVHNLFQIMFDNQGSLFINPSARAGYDTMSIFKRSLTGLNSEFSFS